MSHGTGILTKLEEVIAWQAAVEEALGDPAKRTALLCLPWLSGLTLTGNIAIGLPDPTAYGVRFLGHRDGKGGLELCGFCDVPLPVTFDVAGMKVANGELQDFGIEKLCPGTWALSPSLNVPDLIHGFVVLHGVPDPAPWESLIVVVSA